MGRIGTNLKPHRMQRWLPVFLISVVAGCTDESGPDPFVTTRVTGRIRAGSQYLDHGWVEFLPIDGAVGPMASGEIGADGRFVIERVPVGLTAVGILGARISRDHSRLFDSLRTPIRRTILAGQTQPIEIDLIEEVYLYQSAQKAASSR